jgi:hypothetical protein
MFRQRDTRQFAALHNVGAERRSDVADTRGPLREDDGADEDPAFPRP